MCLYPKLIYNRKYTKTKKNGGRVPPLPLIKFNGKMIEDERVLWVPVGCGRCMECMKKKSREWSVRLQEEIRHNQHGIFVTLTFSDKAIQYISKKIEGIEGYERDNAIAKHATRKFLERWRKKYKTSIRHWLTTELGHEGTENIHMHGIIWLPEGMGKWHGRNEIERIWKSGKDEGGFVYPKNEDLRKNYISERTINYISKYITKVDKEHTEYKPIVLTSPGIGKQYIERSDSIRNKFKLGKTNETYTTKQLRKLGLPIYYRNQIYTEEEREKLWQEKLDQKIRWVNGVKIDVSKNEKEYYKALNEARIKNKELGYQDDEINWNKKRYENSKRNLKHKQRLWRANKNEAEKADKEIKEIAKSRYEKIKESLDLKECPF